MFEFLKSRAAQLVARYAGGALMFLAGYLHVDVSQAQADQAGATLALLVVGGLLWAYDYVLHRKRYGAMDAIDKAAKGGSGGGPTVRLGAFLYVLVGLAACTGCMSAKAPPEVTEGRALKRNAIQAYAQANDQIVEGILGAYRAQAYDALEQRIKRDIDKAVVAAGKTGGQVDITQALGFMDSLQSDREAGRTKIDASIQQIRQAMDKGRVNLAIAMKIDEALEQYESAGVDMSAARKAVDDVLQLVGQLTGKAAPPALPAPAP